MKRAAFSEESDVQHTGEHGRLVGDDAYGTSVDTARSRQRYSPRNAHALHEITVVNVRVITSLISYGLLALSGMSR
jgi:hypothetical protein